MRGKIIQYNGNDGTGLMSTGGRQFDFSIRQWQGEVAPTVNRVVEITLEGETVASVSAVPEEVLLREKAAELKEKLGGAGSLLSTGGGEFGRNLLAQLGVPLAAAYGVFFLASLVVNFGTVRTMGMGVGTTLYDLVAHFSQMGKGSYQILLFGAYFSFLVPVFWKHRFAPLATLLPAVILLVFVWAIYGDYANATAAFDNEMQMKMRLVGDTAFGRKMLQETMSTRPSFSNFFSFGLGFYLCLAASLAVGWFGAAKTLRTLVPVPR